MHFRTSLILLLLAAPTFAQLRWEKPTQSFERSPGDPAVEATYAFKNVGAAPVTISKLRSSCGCTAAKLEQRTYAPGESGAITAKFTLGDRRGLQVVGVTVTTDDKSAEPTQLILRVNIADPLKVEPALVWWRVGAAAEPKVVQLTAESTRPVRVKSVTSTNPRITAKLNTSAAGQRYSLTVAPQDTTSKEVAEIRVQTDFPPDAPRSYLIYARVK
jgi:Protein of unknown function (DUF1573)